LNRAPLDPVNSRPQTAEKRSKVRDPKAKLAAETRIGLLPD
jgi:hypothetical protein